MSPSCDNAAEPARALNSLAVEGWEALRWRELVWDALPHPVKASTIPYLTVQEVGRLDSAMTNREARPHLVESYKGMQSPAFNSYRYEYRKGGDHKELQWARERGIDLRGFTLGLEGVYRSGPVLVELMGGYREKNLYDLDTATYYAKRGKLTYLDEVTGGYMGYTALTCACEKGYSEMVECLLAAGADKEKADKGGWTPLIYAVSGGHVEVVRLLLSAGADTDKADRYGYTPLIEAVEGGHVEVVRLLLSAGADKEKPDRHDWTDSLTWTTQRTQREEITKLLQGNDP
jgi:hypothetical protein